MFKKKKNNETTVDTVIIEGSKDSDMDGKTGNEAVRESSKDTTTDKGSAKTAVTEASKDDGIVKGADDTALTKGDSEVSKANKKNFVSFELKNSLIMVVVALISFVCSFVFVSRSSTSLDDNDIEVKGVDSVSTVEETRDTPQRVPDVKLQNKEDDVNKIKTDRIKADKVNKASAEKGNDDDTYDNEAVDIQDSIVVPLESIVVNLGGIDSNRYLRIQLNLEVDSEDTQKLINEKMVIIRDKMISFLSTKTVKDLNTEGGLFKLRLEIRDSLNKLLGSHDKIRKIYISDFIVQ